MKIDKVFLGVLACRDKRFWIIRVIGIGARDSHCHLGRLEESTARTSKANLVDGRKETSHVCDSIDRSIGLVHDEHLV